MMAWTLDRQDIAMVKIAVCNSDSLCNKTKLYFIWNSLESAYLKLH